MDKKTGMCASLLTLAAVLAFAFTTAAANSFLSFLSSMFIAFGFVPMICSFASYAKKGAKAPAFTAVAFAAVYAVLIMLVYFAQLTAVRLEALNDQAKRILDYGAFGLFFSYDLLGYAFMALSTFCIAFTIDARTKRDRWLKALLLVHGLFAPVCIIIPMLGLFHPGMQGGDLAGVLVLELWCIYFVPVCVLSRLHFKSKQ